MLATAIYENGVLKPLTLLPLPENTRVQIQILTAEGTSGDDDTRRAEAALIASGLVKSAAETEGLKIIPTERRAELAHLYAKGKALSDTIIEEREGR